ncbi:DUF4013 domain-containing protein [bacterium]|nr:DUF4013 domain-containing protein [bacterium]
MNIKRAFIYIFEDKQWFGKFIIGMLLCLVPFIGWWIILGYLADILQRIIKGADIPLPEWDEIGTKFVKGFLLAVGLFAYSIPGVILSFIPCFGNLLSTLYYIGLGLYLPWIYLTYSQEENLGSIFNFEKGFSFMKDNFINVLIIFILKNILGLCVAIVCAVPGIIAVVLFVKEFWVFGILFGLATLVLGIAGSVYLYLVSMRLYGEVYFQYIKKTESGAI